MELQLDHINCLLAHLGKIQSDLYSLELQVKELKNKLLFPDEYETQEVAK